MATTTTNLGLTKPSYSDTADIAVINGNMDKIDTAANALEAGFAIISNNNTHDAISSGQYVYVRGHGTLAEGLYKATTNIAANGTLSGSNLTSVKMGNDLAALSDNIVTIENSAAGDAFSEAVSANTITTVKSKTLSAGLWVFVSYMDLNIGVNDVYINRISNDNNDQNVRASGVNGGGSVNVKLISVASSTTVEVKAYVPSACTVRGNVFYFRLR